jgi:hypothetical protein
MRALVEALDLFLQFNSKRLLFRVTIFATCDVRSCARRGANCHWNIWISARELQALFYATYRQDQRLLYGIESNVEPTLRPHAIVDVD